MEQIIRDEIGLNGPMSFRRFMSLALYHPEHGYYEQPCLPQTGKKGDFYTSVSVGPVFGELLAHFIATEAHNLPGPLTIVEAGAHSGQLACDLLTTLKVVAPEILTRTTCRLLEPSPTRREAQTKTLHDFRHQVIWSDSLQDLPATAINGFVLSNELLDAFPVHRLGWSAADKGWFEWQVDWQQDHLDWLRTTPADLPADLQGHLPPLSDELAALLPDGFTTEICPAATEWWEAAANKLQTGWLLTFDYGLEGLDFLTPGRNEGTLRAYQDHKLVTDLLANPGQQDLTAHINFTAIREAGERAGLQTVHDETQARFLTRLLANAPKNANPATRWSPAQMRQFQTLTHPDHLGRSFRVLGQRR